MKTLELSDQHAHYRRVSKAIEYLFEHGPDQPSLSELASAVGMSEFHLQRIFSEWVGVSPKQFLQFLTKEHAKRALRESSVLDAALASGLSGSSRLHDLLITHESVTPGEFKQQGKNLAIRYGAHSSRFGYCFIAITERGLCKLAFFDDLEGYAGLVGELNTNWKNAVIEEDQQATLAAYNSIFRASAEDASEIKLLLRGTPFRLLVWEALLKIPQGALVSYQQVAQAIGKPASVRAVASAVASNDIGYLIPCHRVIRGSGALSGYRWGQARKAAVVGWETVQIKAGTQGL